MSAVSETLQARDLEPRMLRAAMSAQGFVLLPSVFDTSLMNRLRVELDRARAAEEERFGLAALEEIGQEGYVSDLLAIGRAMEAVLDSDVLHHVLTALFGDDAHLYIGQGIILDPGKGRGVWPRCWHADMYQARMALHDPTFCFGVNCLVMVDNVSEENGPTGVLPGSQGLKALRVESEDELRKIEFRAVAPSGSLLLLDAGVWHSANMNCSDGPRRVVKLLFTRRWIRPQIDYAAVVSEDVARRLSNRVRRFLHLPSMLSANDARSEAV
jgi:ectoine hydroxylase-related dioxygenase (phytanoyl-CoA dioxygenase family)